MSYESPINIIMGRMNIAFENEVCKAVQNIGVNVNKAELLKALAYDREQYEKGYADGKAEHDEQIVPNWNDTDKCYCCGKCGKAIVFLWRKYDGYRENYKYCTSCGQAVKWQ